MNVSERRASSYVPPNEGEPSAKDSPITDTTVIIYTKRHYRAEFS